MFLKWLENIALSIDQLGNVLLGGSPDESISSRLGKLKRSHDGTIPWSHPVSKIVDAGLDLIDPNHSIDAIEDDEGSDDVIHHEH